MCNAQVSLQMYDALSQNKIVCQNARMQAQSQMQNILETLTVQFGSAATH